MKRILLLIAMATPATAQVITSPTALPDTDSDGVIVIAKSGPSLSPPQAKGTALVRCPALPGFSYVAKGTDCPSPARPLAQLDGTKATTKAPVTTWAKMAAMTAASDVTVNGLTYRTLDGKAENVTVDGLIVPRIFRTGARTAPGSHDVAILNSKFIHRPDANTQASDLPEGIDFQGCIHCRVENVEVAFFRGGDSYHNGDGSNVEHGDEDITYRKFYTHDNSDSGFDWLKGRTLRAYDSVSENNARGVKSGAIDARMESVTFRDNRTAVEFHGGDLTLVNPTFDVTGRTSKTWIISAEAGVGTANTITMSGCKVIGSLHPTPDSVVIAKGPGVTINMDDACKAALR